MTEDENHCDECGLPLDRCRWWSSVEKAREEIKKGNCQTFTLEEYMRYLQEDES